MLEIMVHGWQDCIAREQMGWGDRRRYVNLVLQWLDEASARNAVFSYVQHDWSSIRNDPHMAMTRQILEHALELGMRVLNGKQYYQERLASDIGSFVT